MAVNRRFKRGSRRQGKPYSYASRRRIHARLRSTAEGFTESKRAVDPNWEYLSLWECRYCGSVYGPAHPFCTTCNKRIEESIQISYAEYSGHYDHRREDRCDYGGCEAVPSGGHDGFCDFHLAVIPMQEILDSGARWRGRSTFEQVPTRVTRSGKMVWDGFHLDNPTLSYLSDGRESWATVIVKILGADTALFEVPPGLTRGEYAKRLQVMLHSNPRVRKFSWSTKSVGEGAILVSRVAESKSRGRMAREATATERYLRGDSYKEIAKAVGMSHAWVKWLIRARHLTGRQGRENAA